MGSITTRKRADGTVGYTAQIRLKQGGQVVHSEAQTFDRKQAANAWLKKRETELAQPGALEALQKPDPTLGQVIAQYKAEARRAMGKTKLQVLAAIERTPLAKMRCSQIASHHLVEFAQGLKVQPQTVGNYMSHLGAVFAIARPAWGYPLSKQAMDDATAVARRLGVVARSNKRERRPTLAELEALLGHFEAIRARRANSNPMVDVVLFALFSTRRLEEITLLRWADLNEPGSKILVRNMKHPGDKMGNDQWVDLPPEALAVVQRQPRRGERIFEVSTDAVGAAFTRACKVVGVEDLHFHDLRHEGVSRLFELGWTIPRVAQVSGHRSWSSLKRYAHLHQVGDKYEGWRWLG